MTHRENHCHIVRVAVLLVLFSIGAISGSSRRRLPSTASRSSSTSTVQARLALVRNLSQKVPLSPIREDRFSGGEIPIEKNQVNCEELPIPVVAGVQSILKTKDRSSERESLTKFRTKLSEQEKSDYGNSRHRSMVKKLGIRDPLELSNTQELFAELIREKEGYYDHGGKFKLTPDGRQRVDTKHAQDKRLMEAVQAAVFNQKNCENGEDKLGWCSHSRNIAFNQAEIQKDKTWRDALHPIFHPHYASCRETLLPLNDALDRLELLYDVVYKYLTTEIKTLGNYKETIRQSCETWIRKKLFKFKEDPAENFFVDFDTWFNTMTHCFVFSQNGVKLPKPASKDQIIGSLRAFGIISSARE